MWSTGLRRRKARAQLAVRTGLAALMLLTCGTAAGLAGYLDAAVDAGARSTMRDAGESRLAFEVSSRGGDPDRVGAALAEKLAQLLPDVSYQLHRNLIAGPRIAYPGADGRPRGAPAESLGQLVLAAYQDLADHAELVVGRWPTSANPVIGFPVAVHAVSAARLGISVGDSLSFTDRDEVILLRVVGLWRPLERSSAYWFDLAEARGHGSNTDLLAAMTEADLLAVPGLTLTTRWRLIPDLNRLREDDLSTLRLALPRLVPLLDGDDRTSGSRLESDIGLLAPLRKTDDRLSAARAALTVPLLLFALASVLTMALMGRLPAVARRPQPEADRASRAPVGRLMSRSLAELWPVYVFSPIAGAAAAWVALRAVTGVDVSVTPLALAAGTAAALAAVVLTVVGIRSELTADRAAFDGRSRTGKRRRVVLVGSAVVAVALAAATVWRLLDDSGLAGENARGVTTGDPPVNMAPVALLAAAGLVVIVAVILVARAGQRLMTRRRNLASVQAVRSVARRPAWYAVPAVLIVLAAGSGALAAGVSGTSSDLQRDAAAHRTGSDLQVVLTSRPATTSDPPPGAALEPYRRLRGVTSVTPVLSGIAQLGDTQVQLVALPDDRVPPDGTELPAATDSIELTYTATTTAHEVDRKESAEPATPPETPPDARVRVHLWLADADGLLSLVRADDIVIADGPAASLQVVRTALPAGAAPWTFVGLELSFDGRPGSGGTPQWAHDYDISLAQIRSVAGEVTRELRAPADWSLGILGEPRSVGRDFAIRGAEPHPGLVITSGGVPYPSFEVRLLAGEWTIGGGPTPVAVRATREALDESGLVVGDQVTARVSGADVLFDIAGTVEAVPGTQTDRVLVADLAEFTTAALASNSFVPRPNQIWIDAADDSLAGGALARAAASIAGPYASVLDRAAIEEGLRANPFARMSLVVYWVVAAAVVLLAGAGLAAAAARLFRERRPEVEMLRTLGASAKIQTRLARRELLLVAGLAVPLAAAAGWLVTTLVAGGLAATATPVTVAGWQPAVRIATLPWAASVAVLAALTASVAVVHGERTRRQAAAAGRGRPAQAWVSVPESNGADPGELVTAGKEDGNG